MKGLAFSGGKDSWACLWLEEDLTNTTVFFVNTGKCYPEQLEMVEMAKKMCPLFVEIHTSQEQQNTKWGLPSDVVPINWSHFGQLMTNKKDISIQSYLECCYENIGGALDKKIKEIGITHLVRGQRNDESHKSSVSNGTTVDGITYLHPIEDWTKQQVMEFLETKMAIPEHFYLNHTSLDCYDCTAYKNESKDRIEYTKSKHPEMYEKYKTRKTQLDKALNEALA